MGKEIAECIKIYIKNLLWDIYESKRAINSEIHLKQTVEQEIVCRDEMAGLFSYVEICMRKTINAIGKNKVPYVDMSGCLNPYLDECDFDSVNWWELFFEQPLVFNDSSKCDLVVSLPKVGKCVNGEIPHSRSAVLLKESRWFWGNVYREFFHLNSVSLDYCNKEYEELFESGQLRVLGVLIRGTDYKGAKGHPIQPSFRQIAKAVKKRAGKYDKIYVATDEQKNVTELEKIFPGKILVNKRCYYDGIDMSGKSINDIVFSRENDKYLRGLEYLSSVMLLSRCNGLVAGISGGSVAAVYINNNKYEDLKLFYLGLNN